MLIKLLPHQVPVYRDIIDITIEKSFPICEERIKTDIYKELLLGIAQCWIYHEDQDESKFKGVLITQIRNDIAVGRKTLTLLAMHAPEGIHNDAFLSSWPILQAFGKKHGCEIFDFYSNNTEAIKYARLFHIVLETTYFQVDLNH